MAMEETKEKRTYILFEKLEDGLMNSEVEGSLKDIVSILLTGIEKMFDDPMERAIFKTGLKKVYDHWSEEEAGAND